VLRIAVDKQKELATVVGTAPGVAVGQHVTAAGAWVKEKNFGAQFQARTPSCPPAPEKTAVFRQTDSWWHLELGGGVSPLNHVPEGRCLAFGQSWCSAGRNVRGGAEQAKTIEMSSPHTAEGMAKYLGSGLIKGIGPVYGNRMVERFGDKVRL
jgi:hypothetical protein